MEITATNAAELTIALSARLEDGRIVATHCQLPDHQPLYQQLAGLELDAAAARLRSEGPYPRRAHSLALAAAGKAASGVRSPLSDERTSSIERELAAEAADVHLYQLMLLWPRAVAVDRHRTQYSELHRRLRNDSSAAESFELGGELLDLLAREMLGGFYNNIRYPRSLSEFIERADRGSVLGEVLRKLLDLGASQPARDKPTPILGELSAAAWHDAFGHWPDADSIAAPLFFGAPAETGPLARHAASPLVHMLLRRGHRLSARLFAKVSELSDCASRLRYPLSDEVPPLLDSAAVADNVGIARVNTATGVLLCWVRMADGHIAECTFIEPAAWNFHPQGAFNNEACADTIESADAARLRLSLLALALEPGLLACIELESTTQAAPATADDSAAAAARDKPRAPARRAAQSARRR